MNKCGMKTLFTVAGLALLAALPGCVLDWSPDGKPIVFVWADTTSRDASEHPRLAVINSDGSGFRFLPGAESGFFPSWAPDGKRLAVYWLSSSGEKNAGLAVYDADG